MQKRNAVLATWTETANIHKVFQIQIRMSWVQMLQNNTDVFTLNKHACVQRVGHDDHVSMRLGESITQCNSLSFIMIYRLLQINKYCTNFHLFKYVFPIVNKKILEMSVVEGKVG